MIKLNIQLFAEVSETFVGSLNGSYGSNAQFYAIRTYSQNEDTVTTSETIKLYIKKLNANQGSYNPSATYSLKINGTSVKSGTFNLYFPGLAVGGSALIATYTRTLTHEEDGSYPNYTLAASISTGTSLGDGSLSKTVSTPTISTSYAVAAQDINIDYNNAVAITVGVREGTNYTYDLNYSIGDGTTVGLIEGTIATGQTSGSYLWEMNSDLINTIKDAMVTTNTTTLTIKCITKKDGTQIGAIKQTIVNINILTGPTFDNCQIAELVPAINALTQGSSIVKGLSKLKFTITATAPRGTSIDKYQVHVGSQIFESTSNEITIENLTEQTNGEVSFAIRAIDKRSNSGDTFIIAIPFIDYITAEYINTTSEVQRSADDIDKITVNLKANYFNNTIGTTQNVLTLGYKYKARGDADYTTGVTTLSLDTDITLTESFDLSKNYELIFTINDLIYIGSEMTKQIASSQYVMFEHENGVDFLNATIQSNQVIHANNLDLVPGRIVETGTANSGNYIKFDNGIMICTKIVTVPSTTVVSAYFAGTYGTYCTLGAMPATFTTLWSINATAMLTNTTDWLVGNIYNSSVSSMGTARLCRPNTTGTISGRISVFAIGLWK